MRQSAKFTVQGPLYDNCSIYSPDDRLMCRCPRNKIDWYVRNNLAEYIDENSIRLLFEPHGYGQDNKYLLQLRENCCVVCGSQKELTRHHVVGQAFRAYFPTNFLKSLGSYDILALCLDCHLKYQEPELKYVKELFKKHGFIESKMLHDGKKRKVSAAAWALIKDKEICKIPQEKKQNFEAIVKEYFAIDSLTDEILKEASEIQAHYQNPNWEDPYSRILTVYSFDDFSILWRKHFVSTMKPKFLSPLWDVSVRLYETYEKTIREEK